jgi:NADPH2:quinone reductase
MRAVQITGFGGPEVLEIVDVPEPEAGPNQKVYDLSTAGINYADTHHRR